MKEQEMTVLGFTNVMLALPNLSTIQTVLALVASVATIVYTVIKIVQTFRGDK